LLLVVASAETPATADATTQETLADQPTPLAEVMEQEPVSPTLPLIENVKSQDKMMNNQNKLRLCLKRHQNLLPQMM